MVQPVHHDNDFFRRVERTRIPAKTRQFLDSGDSPLTIICCFTDMDAEGGATCVYEDGIKRE